MFPAGELLECITVTINDDSSLEGDQMFNILLSNIDTGVQFGNNVTDIIIVDNDGNLFEMYVIAIN